MAKAYQYDANGYYAGETEDCGLLPNNAAYTAPKHQDGFIPCWNGAKWEQVENHKGKEGFVEGKAFTVNDYGPLPEGWSDTPPPPTLDEAVKAKLDEVMNGYAAAFAPIQAIYPAQEREGWPIQLEEARALLENPLAEAPTLADMVNERGMGESTREFADIVIANNALYRAVYAKLTGQQQRMYRDVQSMAVTPGITAEEVAAYLVEYEMPRGCSQIQALALEHYWEN